MNNEEQYNLITLRPIGRSGSFFLQNLFDGHPEILLFPFPFPYYYHWRVFHILNKRPTLDVLIRYYLGETSLKYLFQGNTGKFSALFYSYIAEGGSKKEYKIDKEKFEQNLRGKLATDKMPPRKAFLVAIHEAFAETTGVSLKDRSHIFLHEHYAYYTEDPQEDFADAKNIFMARDHLNSFASYWKFNEKYRGYLAPLYQCQDMNETVNAFVNASLLKKKFPEHAYFLKTESMNADPEKEMRALAKWTGIDFTPSLLEPTLAGHKSESVSAFADTKKSFDPKALTEKRWEGVCSGREVSLLNTIFAPLARSLGYPMSGSALSPLRFFLLLIKPDLHALSLRHNTFRLKLIYLVTLVSAWTRICYLRNYYMIRTNAHINPVPWRVRFFHTIMSSRILKRVLQIAN